MEDTSDKFIDLISTASLDMYPQNTPGCFTNALLHPLEFPENTHVALEEIAFTNCFYNVEGNRNTLTLWDRSYANPPHSRYNPTDEILYGHFFDVQLKEGYYSSVQKLCDMVNQILRESESKQFKGKNVFRYDESDMKIHYDLKGLEVALFIRGPVLNLFGIEIAEAKVNQYVVIGIEKHGNTFEWKKKDGTFETRRYISGGDWNGTEMLGKMAHVAPLSTFSTMAIYTDVITSQVTGNVYSDILRFVPIKAQGVLAETIYECRTPYYLKLRKRYIRSITIHIKNLQNEFINFRLGQTRLKLRFKQIP